MENNCEHKYVYHYNKKYKEDRHFGVPLWRRIDFFYCEKCLEEKQRIKEDNAWETPDWY